MNTDPADHDALHHLVGAYVLGALEPGERALFDQHLALCPRCAGELKSLGTLAGFLDAVPAETAIRISAPETAAGPAPGIRAGSTARAGAPEAADQPGLVPLMAQLATRRRRTRGRTAVLVSGAAAAFLIIGLAAGPALTGSPKPDESYTSSTASGPQVQLGLVKKAWGTELALDGRGLPDRGVLSLWVRDTSGNYDRAASWNATAQGQAKVTGATPVTITDVATIEIRDTAGQKIAVLARATGN
ncbi:MAG: zf-HC2 domain-containing protein [Pseudarthrobacter sp.]